ncbi:MAG: hypothetical protein RIR26_2057 [Pseudomonadota bacterium]
MKIQPPAVNSPQNDLSASVNGVPPQAALSLQQIENSFTSAIPQATHRAPSHEEPPASTIAFPDPKPLTQYSTPADGAVTEGKKDSNGKPNQKKGQEKEKQKKSQYFEKPPLSVEHRELEHLLSVKAQEKSILGMKPGFFFVLIFFFLVLVGYIFGDTTFTH